MSQEALSPRQFFHGTRYKFRPGQVLEGGRMRSNQGAGQPGEHVYFSTHPHVAGVFAEAGYGPQHDVDARPRVYPLDAHEADPDELPEAGSFRARRVKVLREIPPGNLS